MIVALRGMFARREESRRLEIGGYRQWNWHIFTIQNKLNNTYEVYITFEIWSGLMVSCNKGLFSLRENIHAQDPYCVNIGIFLIFLTSTFRTRKHLGKSERCDPSQCNSMLIQHESDSQYILGIYWSQFPGTIFKFVSGQS